MTVVCVTDTPDFAIFRIGIAGRPYSSVSTTVLHCERVIIASRLSTGGTV